MRALLGCIFLLAFPALNADEPKAPPAQPPAPPQSPPAQPPPPAPANTLKPADRVEATPKGQLKNPYTDDNAAIVEAGHKLYMRYGCNGCHGGNGGGGRAVADTRLRPFQLSRGAGEQVRPAA